MLGGMAKINLITPKELQNRQWAKNGPLDIPKRGSGVKQKHISLDIPEVGSGVKQTHISGYTRGGIRCYTNTDPWIY
jgi:hypothetical protein